MSFLESMNNQRLTNCSTLLQKRLSSAEALLFMKRTFGIALKRVRGNNKYSLVLINKQLKRKYLWVLIFFKLLWVTNGYFMRRLYYLNPPALVALQNPNPSSIQLVNIKFLIIFKKVTILVWEILKNIDFSYFIFQNMVCSVCTVFNEAFFLEKNDSS